MLHEWSQLEANECMRSVPCICNPYWWEGVRVSVREIGVRRLQNCTTLMTPTRALILVHDRHRLINTGIQLMTDNRRCGLCT